MSTTEQNWKQDYLDLHEMYTTVVGERDTLRAENDRLLEGKVQDAETIHVLEQALAKCVASLDQLLPYLAKVPADIGLLNDALMAARPLLKAERAEPAPAQDEQYPPCDFCGVIPDHHPWHGSGMFKGVDSPHLHACNECRHLLPSRPAQTEQQPEQSGLNDDSKEAAMQKAFELGGLEDGSYHLESDELELVIRSALSAQGGE